jgi:signal transduction histidine kinase
MRRFRILFAVVAAALLVPTALLARRALQGVEVERRARYEAVAERLFDEMERSLSGVLAVEEERPFGHYAREYTPPGEPPGSLVRSPLAEPPALPFIIGYFQIDPDGRFQSPLRPVGREDPPAASSSQAAAAAEVERVVGGYWRSGESGAKLRAAFGGQAPGSTLELDRGGGIAPAPKSAMRDERAAERRVSAYDALRSLNKGIEQRADRQTKISREYASEEPAATNERERSDTAERAAAIGASRDDGSRSDRPDEAERFELSPMVGRRVGDRRLMLYRTVVHEQQGYRQGLLLDVARLGEWLREQALGASELRAFATVAFGVDDASLRPDSSQRVYQHRFAEPFEELSARLVLAPLPGLAGTGTVHALAALALLAAVLGLAALYRMVAVGLRYAEQRSNFVAAVTHELKTPLTAIRMYGEMLRDGMVASEAKRDEYHRHITAESERLSRLVNNVLELARLERRRGAKGLDAGQLAPVVQEVAELVRPHVEGAGFLLRLDVEGDLPPVRFDRDALKQVLFNLVDNAVKYAAGCAPKEIQLRCHRDGADLRLAVRDRGPGVPAGSLRRIFQPFYRAETELTRRSRGTGIGLALVRGLAEEMGARVAGRNLPEGGFEVEIRFAVPARGPEAVAQTIRPTRAPS